MFLGEKKLKELLTLEYMEAKARNSSFSMRAFARKLGIPQSAISEILNDKRNITHKMAIKILSGLAMPPSQIAEILATESGSDQAQFVSLDMKAYSVISDWRPIALISLIETKNFRSDPKWIAKRLGIAEKVVVESLKTLESLDLIKIDKKTKKISLTHEQIEAIPPVATAALKKANRENLELALQKLDSTKFEERDFTAITMCFDPDRMEEAKKLIKEFRRKFCKIMESGNKKEVYKLCVQLYPLSNIES